MCVMCQVSRMDYDYTFESSSEDLDGGWQLQSFKNDIVVGGSVFDDCDTALVEATDWLCTRSD
jgi:hypothetical protein